MFHLFIFVKRGLRLSEAEPMSRYGTFTAMIRSGCGFIQDVEENLFCCFFSPRILRGDDRCWHFTFSCRILKGAE